MTWQRDGSGLEVKRVRGMTLNRAFVRQARALNAPRETKRQSVGYLSEVDLGRCAIRMARERRRDRRAKRLAKAAARRSERLMACLRPFIHKMAEASSRAMSARWAAFAQLAADPAVCANSRSVSQNVPGAAIEYEFSLGTGDKSIVVRYDSSGGPVAKLHAEAERDAAETISRAIIGEVGHALGS